MPFDLYLAFIAATVVLILLPGPNVALIVANSIAHGRRYGLLTVAGTSSAMVVQLALTIAGTAVLLAALAGWFEWLRWIGAAYLVYLGVRAWRSPPMDFTHVEAQPRSARQVWLHGFLVSFTNPKTLLFYGAFMPQFLDPDRDPFFQLVILAITFLVIAIVLDAGWALVAARWRRVLTVNGKLRNRLTGGLLVGAGLGLALARKV